MRQWTVGYLAAIATLTAATTAEAASIPITSVTPTVLFADFNVIVQNNLSSSNDIQGPVMVGCPATGCVSTQGLHSTSFVNDASVVLGTTPGTTGITGYGEVNVFSNVLAGTNATVFGSVTYIGGAQNGTLINTGAGSVLGGYAFPNGGTATVATNPATFQTFIYSPLKTLSTSLGSLSSPSTVTGTVNPVFKGVANAAGQAVFNLSLAQLNSYSGLLSFQGCLAATNLGGPCDGVINVTDATGTLNQGFAFPAGGFTNLIVNFEGNVTADVKNVWTASILDPLGSVMGTHQIDGDVFAMNFTTSDETHFVPFDCSDNLCAPMSFPPLPEPGSLTLLGSAFAAFAGMAAIRRRRA